MPPSTLNPNVNCSYIHQLNAFFWGPHIVGMFFIQCTFPLYLVDLEQILILGFLRVIWRNLKPIQCGPRRKRERSVGEHSYNFTRVDGSINHSWMGLCSPTYNVWRPHIVHVLHKQKKKHPGKSCDNPTKANNKKKRTRFFKMVPPQLYVGL